MNVQQLCKSLKHRWLTYYQDNRDWLIHLAIWVDDHGQRRPSSSFILGTLSVLEPRLTQLLPLIVGLNNNPDRIIAVLGLNISPDDALRDLEAAAEQPKMLPAQIASPEASKPAKSIGSRPALAVDSAQLDASKLAARQDESCGGRYSDRFKDR